MGTYIPGTPAADLNYGGVQTYFPRSTAGTVLPTKHAEKEALHHVAAGTDIDVTTASGDFTHLGDQPDMGADANIFRSTDVIRIYLNGVLQDKTVDVAWVSPTKIRFLTYSFDRFDDLTVES